MVEAKQYGERVNIVKYVRVEKKWRFAAVVEKQGQGHPRPSLDRPSQGASPRRQVLPRMVPRWETSETFGWRV